jgi:undecaprenyl pyrophosphate synthase
MSLAAEKLQILSQKSELIKRHRVRINVLGAIHMLPRHVQISAAEAMLSTIHHEK